MDKTSIGWTRGEDGSAGATWNPIRVWATDETGEELMLGWFCEKVSAECDGCYAEGLNLYRGNGLRYTRNDLVEFRVDEKMLLAPLRWQRSRKIFPCSMTDWMLRHYPDEWIFALLGVAILARQHTFQFLTKRSERQRNLLSKLAKLDGDLPVKKCVDAVFDLATSKESRRLLDRIGRKMTKQSGAISFPPANAWIGVSIGTESSLFRAAHLAATPAALRWWSVEPYIGIYTDHWRTVFRGHMRLGQCDWFVFGGESGGAARVCRLHDALLMISDCARFGVPFFFKQTGRFPVLENGETLTVTAKGEDPSEWPERFRIQEFPK